MSLLGLRPGGLRRIRSGAAWSFPPKHRDRMAHPSWKRERFHARTCAHAPARRQPLIGFPSEALSTRGCHRSAAERCL